ncbi:hypothetical protein DAPPUDRAFT_251151 [Daphnia pulex]|uniref:Uncharacterized protein n=1 Tax=Daphnia pulex TaxID=6669 RepID=E9GZU2_DAPPU|nr:hypothetical protein DAPPUDRAFT_251151 [Daphnia pulex]|eukprot:EFX74870.1 hypothetical protein DAPPUDRAFT_251151 [Daphnia pulex]
MASKLGLMQMTNAMSVRKETSSTLKVKAKLPRLFNGIGKLKDFFSQTPHRQIRQAGIQHSLSNPPHLQVPVEKELKH